MIIKVKNPLQSKKCTKDNNSLGDSLSMAGQHLIIRSSFKDLPNAK